MIDIHCHLLHGIDDGAKDLETSLEMARMAVADGVQTIVCTPHIMPGVYDNTPPDIRARVQVLAAELEKAHIPLQLLPGCDAHIRPDFVDALRTDRIQPIGAGRYVLFEPPHNVAPPRIDDILFNICASGWVPILTHPERLTWIEGRYGILSELVRAGVLMQITAASLTGVFGERARHFAERMLSEGLVHIVASDAHNARRRTTRMSQAVARLRELVGGEEARNLVFERPRVVIENGRVADMPPVPFRGPVQKKAGLFAALTSRFHMRERMKR